MQTYRSYQRSHVPVGAIVLKLYKAGDTVRGFIREVEDIDEDGTAFPDVALRLAENKRQGIPNQPIFIELAEGVQWNPKWGVVAN